MSTDPASVNPDTEEERPPQDMTGQTLPRRLAGQPRPASADTDVNLALLGRLAERAVESGDIRGAVEAVRTCMAEAESLYQQAMHERVNAASAAGRAADERHRAEAMREHAEAMRHDAMRTYQLLEAQQSQERPHREPGLPVSDVPGQDLRPDPRTARNGAEFIEALRQFRIWAGNHRSGTWNAPSAGTRSLPPCASS